jgi:hypothetical protein
MRKATQHLNAPPKRETLDPQHPLPSLWTAFSWITSAVATAAGNNIPTGMYLT